MHTLHPNLLRGYQHRDEATFSMDGHLFVKLINRENRFLRFQQQVALGISRLHFQLCITFNSPVQICFKTFIYNPKF